MTQNSAILDYLFPNRVQKRRDEEAEAKRKQEDERRGEQMRALSARIAANRDMVERKRKKAHKAWVRGGRKIGGPLICDCCGEKTDSLCRIGAPLSVFAGALSGPQLCHNCKPNWAYVVSVLS